MSNNDRSLDLGLQPQGRATGEASEVRSHVGAVVWLIALAFAVLGPALSRGGSFGSYDLLGQLGLLHTNAIPHNFQAGDQVDQIIPWTTLAWQQVHTGHLPLWNPYAALGMPLAFNWQSATFSLPMVIGYLLPLRFSYTFQVILTLVIAGTGMYVLGRVLRLGVLGAVFAATVFELCGPMVGWLGWPHAAVLSWSGWVFAAALVTVRGEHRIRSVIALALFVGAAVYAGQTEVLTIMGVALIVFMVVLMTFRARKYGVRTMRRPCVDLVIGGVAGLALGAPLILPGLQIIRGSQRGTSNDPGEIVPGNPPLPFHNVTHLFFQAFDGLPIAGSRWFGYVGGYSETAAYIGVIVVVLAVAAVGVRHRQPEVTAFGVVAVVMASITFVPPVAWVMAHLPLIGSVLWQRSLLLLVFALSILGGIGMDALMKASLRRPAIQWTLGGFVVAAFALLALWLFGRGHLPAPEASIRSRSFIWPTTEIAVGLIVVGGVVLLREARSNPSAPPGAGRSHIDLGCWGHTAHLFDGISLGCGDADLDLRIRPVPVNPSGSCAEGHRRVVGGGIRRIALLLPTGARDPAQRAVGLWHPRARAVRPHDPEELLHFVDRSHRAIRRERGRLELLSGDNDGTASPLVWRRIRIREGSRTRPCGKRVRRHGWRRRGLPHSRLQSSHACARQWVRNECGGGRHKRPTSTRRATGSDHLEAVDRCPRRRAARAAAHRRAGVARHDRRKAGLAEPVRGHHDAARCPSRTACGAADVLADELHDRHRGRGSNGFGDGGRRRDRLVPGGHATAGRAVVSSQRRFTLVHLGTS